MDAGGGTGLQSGNSNASTEGLDAIDWELRPGGMLVQRRDPSAEPSPSSGVLIIVKVAHGLRQHDVTIPSEATFGDIKWALAPLTGLHPPEQRLLFRGKEKEDTDCLHIAGVKDKSKIILVEDPASKERKWDEIKRNESIARACQSVAQVREAVDRLAGKITSLETTVGSGKKVAENEFTLLSELLMRELLKLDSIDAEGDAKVQRKIEVRRIQGFTDAVDRLKVQNNNPLCNNAAVVTTEWETFDTGVGSLSAPHPSASSTMTTNWELFD